MVSPYLEHKIQTLQSEEFFPRVFSFYFLKTEKIFDLFCLHSNENSGALAVMLSYDVKIKQKTP